MTAADRIKELRAQADGYERRARECEDEITRIRANALTAALDRIRDLERQIAAAAPGETPS